MINISVTEGISVGCNGTIRCFINRDYTYGYWIEQKLVESVLGYTFNANDARFGYSTSITVDDANKLIEVGKTPYTKRFIKE